MFLYYYPETQKPLPKVIKFALIPFVSLVSLLTLSPYVFSGVDLSTLNGGVPKTIVEKAVILFVITVIGLIVSGIITFSRKMLVVSDSEKNKSKLILFGGIVMFIAIFVFNLILPALFLVVTYIPLGAVFILPFVSFTAYAIYKHRLFNIKNIASAILAFSICLAAFLEIIFANTTSLIIFRSGIFILTLAIAIQFVRNLFKLENINLSIFNSLAYVLVVILEFIP
jgi:hypothetical protein